VLQAFSWLRLKKTKNALKANFDEKQHPLAYAKGQRPFGFLKD
jgi:hypothetical protein